MSSLLLRGFALGFAIAATPGPIFFLCLRRTPLRGRLYGLVSGIGVATADGLYAAIAAFGFVVVIGAVAGDRRPFALIGGAVLIGLGLSILFDRTERPADPPGASGGGLACSLVGDARDWRFSLEGALDSRCHPRHQRVQRPGDCRAWNAGGLLCLFMNVSGRTRTYSWEDPMALRDAGAGLSGLDYLTAVFERKLPPPPIAATLDFTGAEVEEGRAVFVGQPAEFLYNPIGVVHGGYAMTLLDSAMGCAVQSTLAVGEGYTSLETSVNFVRPITLETGRVRCEAKILHRGGRVATAEGRLIAESTGKLLAHGTTTCLVMKA